MLYPEAQDLSRSHANSWGFQWSRKLLLLPLVRFFNTTFLTLVQESTLDFSTLTLSRRRILYPQTQN